MSGVSPKAFWLLALCAAPVLVTLATSSSYAAKLTPAPSTTAATSTEVQAVANLDAQALAVDSTARSFSDYVGGNLTADGTFDVYLSGPKSAETSQITSTANLPVAVQIVPESLSQLRLVQSAITADVASLSSEGIHITLWGPDPIDDKVNVYVRDLTSEQGSVLSNKYGAAYVHVLAAGPDEIPTFFDLNRENDTAPYFGGDFVYAPSVGIGCTTGPTIASYTNQKYLLTAGHCYKNGTAIENGWYDNYDFTIHGGHANFGTTAYNTTSYYSTKDLDVVYSPLSMSAFDWQTTSVGKQVSSTTLPGGMTVCTSGAYEGQVCGATTAGEIQGGCMTAYSQAFAANLTACGIFRADELHVTIAGTGDSGGPVYRGVAGGLDINGIISAGGSGYACPPGPADPRVCSQTVYYTDMNWILGLNGEHLLK